jgi:leucine dehydrogenase
MALTISEIAQDGYEQVVHFYDDTGFSCLISLHNTNLGPGLGGCRIKSYNSHDDALLDVLRLSKGMTYKSSLAGLNLGGAKAVVNAPKPTREIMLKVGEAVEYFNGRYITAEDVGTTLPDIEIAGEITSHRATLDGSSMTARGVLACMAAAVKYQGKWGSDVLSVPIWVQGLGKVGMDLAYRIKDLEGNHPPGLNLYVSDLRSEAIKEAESFGAREITEDDKRFVGIYAPCAMGQVINDTNVNKIKYGIICGSANNQLTDVSYADVLKSRGVIYVPDFLANAGGVINAACEVGKPFDLKECEFLTDALGDRLLNVFEMADKENISPLRAAMNLAEIGFNGSVI